MKKTISISLISLLFLFLVSAKAEVLTTGADFMKIVTGSRAAGMSGQASALYNDAESLHMNVASLTRLDFMQVMYEHAEWLQNVRYELLSVSTPLKLLFPKQAVPGVFGIGAQMVYITPFSSYDDWGTVIGDVSYSSFFFTAGYALKVLRQEYFDLSLGVNAGFASKSVDSVSAVKPVFTAGLISSYFHKKSDLRKYIGEAIQLSFVAQNIGPAGSEANEGLPLQLKAGVGVKAMNLVDVGIDVVKQMDGGIVAGIGMEYLFRNLLAFRTGGVLSQDSMSKFSVGLGVQQKIGKFKYHIDYAMVPFGALGMTHRVGVKMDIGKIELPDRTDIYYYKGVDYFIQNDYVNAVKMWEKVLAKDPEHPEARKRIDEVKKILKFQEQEKDLKKIQENFQKFQLEQQQKSGEKPAEPKKK